MTTLIKLFAGISLFLGSLFASHATAPTLQGAFNPVQTQYYQLAGAGVTANATSVLLTSMAYSNGSLVSMSDLGSIGFGTIEPGTPKREEQISFTGITQESNGQALLTGVIRGLAFNPGTNGCNGSSTLSVSHAGGVNFVLSNTACFYQQFAITGNTTTISGAYTFTNAPYITNTSTNPNAAVTYQQLASTSFAGTVNASTSQKGIIQLATNAQIASGTATGSSGALLVEPNSNSSLVESSSIVSVQASGTLDPSFLLGGSYSLGSLTSASTTLNGTTTIANAQITSTNLQLGTLIYRTATSSSIGLTQNATATLASLTLPLLASTSTVYHFIMNITGTISNNSATTTISLIGNNTSTTISTCLVGISNGTQGASWDGTITMLASTSVEVLNLTTPCLVSSTPNPLLGKYTINLATTTTISVLAQLQSNTSPTENTTAMIYAF